MANYFQNCLGVVLNYYNPSLLVKLYATWMIIQFLCFVFTQMVFTGWKYLLFYQQDLYLTKKENEVPGMNDNTEAGVGKIWCHKKTLNVLMTFVPGEISMFSFIHLSNSVYATAKLRKKFCCLGLR